MLGLPTIWSLQSKYGATAALVTTRVDDMRFVSAAALGDDLRVVTSVLARCGGNVLWRHSVQSRPRAGEAAVVHATLLAETAVLGAPPAAADSLFQGLALDKAGAGDAVRLTRADADSDWRRDAEGGAGSGESRREETVFADDLDGFGRLSAVRCRPLPPPLPRPPVRPLPSPPTLSLPCLPPPPAAAGL